MLTVSFAAQRPDGAYALAIPAWSEDMIAERLSGFSDAARTLAARAADAQRFEREPATVAETFVDDDGTVRRVLLVGLGGRRDDDAVYERVGGALFAGSLYALAFHAPRVVGAITPIGGIALILGWLALAAGALRGR